MTDDSPGVADPDASADADSPGDIDPDTLWMRTEVDDDGSYEPVMTLGPDVRIVFDEESAVAYATYVLAVCARAEHDAAVLDQLLDMDMEHRMIGRCITELRDLRPDLVTPCPPLSFEPIVASKTRRPMVSMFVDGTQVGERETPVMKRHALQVLEVFPVAALDEAYRRWLVSPAIGLDIEAAHKAVRLLGDHRQPEPNTVVHAILLADADGSPAPDDDERDGEEPEPAGPEGEGPDAEGIEGVEAP